MTGDPTLLGSALAASVLNDVDSLDAVPLAAQPSALGLIEDHWNPSAAPQAESVPKPRAQTPDPDAVEPAPQQPRRQQPPQLSGRAPRPGRRAPLARDDAPLGMVSAQNRALQQSVGSGPASLNVEPLRTAALDTTPLATTQLRVDPLHAAEGSPLPRPREQRAPRHNSVGEMIAVCVFGVMGFAVPILGFAALIGSIAILGTAKEDRAAKIAGVTGLLLSIVSLLASLGIR